MRINAVIRLAHVTLILLAVSSFVVIGTEYSSVGSFVISNDMVVHSSPSVSLAYSVIESLAWLFVPVAVVLVVAEAIERNNNRRSNTGGSLLGDLKSSKWSYRAWAAAAGVLLSWAVLALIVTFL